MGPPLLETRIRGSRFPARLDSKPTQSKETLLRDPSGFYGLDDMGDGSVHAVASVAVRDARGVSRSRGTAWLSVIMPVFNGARYVRHALESVEREADSGLEVIALDGGSTDETVPILRSFAGRLPITVIERDPSPDWVARTNVGLRKASGEYVSFLHHDDLWLPGRMRAVREALKGGSIALLIHPVILIDSRGRRVGRWRSPLPMGVSLSPRMVIERLLIQNFVSVAGTVFPRALALELGGMEEDLWYTADWDLWLKLASKGSTLYVPRPLAAYRVHSMAMSASRSGRLGEFREQQERVLNRHLAQSGNTAAINPDVVNAARLSVEVNVALAAMAHRLRPEFMQLVRAMGRLGPLGLRRYLRDSRLMERLGGRLRARIVGAWDRDP